LSAWAICGSTANIPFGMRHVYAAGCRQFSWHRIPRFTLDLGPSRTPSSIMMQERAADVDHSPFGPLGRNSVLIRTQAWLEPPWPFVATAGLPRQNPGTPANPGDPGHAQGASAGPSSRHARRNGRSCPETGTVEISPPPVGAAPAMVRPAAQRLALGGVGSGRRLALVSYPPRTSRPADSYRCFRISIQADCEDIHAVFLGQGGTIGRPAWCAHSSMFSVKTSGSRGSRSCTPRRNGEMAGQGLLGPNFR